MEITIFQDGIVQDGIAQIVVVIATVLAFRNLVSTVKMPSELITTVKFEQGDFNG